MIMKSNRWRAAHSSLCGYSVNLHVEVWIIFVKLSVLILHLIGTFSEVSREGTGDYIDQDPRTE